MCRPANGESPRFCGCLKGTADGLAIGGCWPGWAWQRPICIRGWDDGFQPKAAVRCLAANGRPSLEADIDASTRQTVSTQSRHGQAQTQSRDSDHSGCFPSGCIRSLNSATDEGDYVGFTAGSTNRAKGTGFTSSVRPNVSTSRETSVRRNPPAGAEARTS